MSIKRELYREYEVETSVSRIGRDHFRCDYIVRKADSLQAKPLCSGNMRELFATALQAHVAGKIEAQGFVNGYLEGPENKALPRR